MPMFGSAFDSESESSSDDDEYVNKIPREKMRFLRNYKRIKAQLRIIKEKKKSILVEEKITSEERMLMKRLLLKYMNEHKNAQNLKKKHVQMEVAEKTKSSQFTNDTDLLVRIQKQSLQKEKEKIKDFKRNDEDLENTLEKQALQKEKEKIKGFKRNDEEPDNTIQKQTLQKEKEKIKEFKRNDEDPENTLEKQTLQKKKEKIKEFKRNDEDLENTLKKQTLQKEKEKIKEFERNDEDLENTLEKQALQKEKEKIKGFKRNDEEPDNTIQKQTLQKEKEKIKGFKSNDEDLENTLQKQTLQKEKEKIKGFKRNDEEPDNTIQKQTLQKEMEKIKGFKKNDEVLEKVTILGTEDLENNSHVILNDKKHTKNEETIIECKNTQSLININENVDNGNNDMQIVNYLQVYPKHFSDEIENTASNYCKNEIDLDEGLKAKHTDNETKVLTEEERKKLLYKKISLKRKPVTNFVMIDKENEYYINITEYSHKPVFYIPIKKLLACMKPIINEFSDFLPKELLRYILNKILIKQITELLDGKDKLKWKSVLDLYREKYPADKDGYFIIDTLAAIWRGDYNDPVDPGDPHMDIIKNRDPNKLVTYEDISNDKCVWTITTLLDQNVNTPKCENIENSIISEDSNAMDVDDIETGFEIVDEDDAVFPDISNQSHSKELFDNNATIKTDNNVPNPSPIDDTMSESDILNSFSIISMDET